MEVNVKKMKKMKKQIVLTRTVMISVAILLCSSGLVVYAATVLFVQNFPGQTFSTAHVVAGTCGSTLVLDTGASIIQLVGQSSILVYACSTLGAAALTTPSTGNTTAIATFTVPTGWTLGVDIISDGCAGGTDQVTLSSGVSHTYPISMDYIYCLTSNSATAFSGFQITWTQ